MLRFIIPAYNEENNVGTLIENTRKFAESGNHVYQIIAVNDGSTDRTRAILGDMQKRLPLVILDQPVNKGVGEAFKLGFSYVAREADATDVIITKEADNTSDLVILDSMIKKIGEGYDLVLASCYMPGGRVNGTNIYRRILSAGANLLVKSVTSLNEVHTYSSFYRAYRATLIKKAHEVYGEKLIEEKGFSCMVELLLKLAKLNIRITEVPMVLNGNLRKGRSKMKVLKTIGEYIRLIARNIVRSGN